MSGSKTAQTAKKLAKTVRKPAAQPFKRAASVVELHAFPGRLMLVSLRGKLGHPARALAQFDDIKLVGALEDGRDMRDIVLQTGTAVLAALTGYPVGTEGTTIQGLMGALVKLSGIDVEKIKAEAAAEAADEVRAELEQQAAMAGAAAGDKDPAQFEAEAAQAAEGQDL